MGLFSNDGFVALMVRRTDMTDIINMAGGGRKVSGLATHPEEQAVVRPGRIVDIRGTWTGRRGVV